MKSRRSYRSTAMLLHAVLFLKLFGCKVNNTIQGSIGSDSNKISVSLEGGSSSVTIAEGSNTNFVLILSSPLAAEASLEWSILDVNGTAATLEFPISSGTLVFPANQLSGYFSIQGSNDTLQKGTRQFSLHFSNPSTPRLDIGSVVIALSVTDDDFVLSSTKLVSNSTSSYVDIDVDWDLNYAYLGSRFTGTCFEVVDFANILAPVVVKTIGSGTTPSSTGNTCLGVRLFAANRRLVVTSNSGNRAEVWNLGTNPSVLNFTRVIDLAVTSARVVAGINEANGLNDTDISIVRTGGVVKLKYNEGAASLVSTWNTALAGSRNGGVVVDGNFVLSGGWANADPILSHDFSTGNLLSTFPMDNGGSSGLWSGAISPDQSKVFVGGWVSGFFKYSALPSPDLSVTKRIDNPSGYRSTAYAHIDGKDYFVAVSSDYYVDVYDATDIDSPQLAYRTLVPGMEGELYGVRVNQNSRRLVVVTNRGDFVLVDWDKMLPAQAQHPQF